MKKHAKKSLLIPILALVSVVAIAACCYLAQSFNAFAGEDELELESSVTEAPEVGATAAGAEDSESNAYETIWARIKFSTEDYLFGSIETKDEGTHPFWPTNELYYEFVNESDDVEYIGYDQISENEMVIFGEPEYTDVIHIQIPAGNVCLNVQNDYVDENHCNITIILAPYYELTFDANGGIFSGGSTITRGRQIVGSVLNLPPYGYVQREGYVFAGWFTDRWFGEQVMSGSPVPEWGTYFVLYAHWVKVSEPGEEININFMQDGFFKQFHYEFGYYTNPTLRDWVSVGSDTVSRISLSELYKKYNVPDDQKLTLDSSYGFGYGMTRGLLANDDVRKSEIFGKARIVLCWTAIMTDENEHPVFWYLSIEPTEYEHFTWATLNGDVIPENTLGSGIIPVPVMRGCYLSKYNNVVLSSSLNVPGYISVASDDGSLFKCRMLDYEKRDTQEFVTDYLPIFVGADDTVMYAHGTGSSLRSYFGENNLEANGLFEYDNDSEVGLYIIVINPEKDYRVYRITSNLFTLFDWFDMNSYIKGVSLDGEDVPVAIYASSLENGYHNFVLRMSDKEADTTVTYDANGGSFAEGKTTMTLDATYGEALPVVENPILAENDFVGWFTEPEGGVQVDPANYHWMPWDRWDGVKLYAHWAYNPQPVPPEPVPPTPDPVNPDVPGGGGAQTGDSMPLAPIAALAVIAALGCGLAIRKETSK